MNFYLILRSDEPVKRGRSAASPLIWRGWRAPV